MPKIHLTEEQLLRASETISVVRELIEMDWQGFERRTPTGRYWAQVYYLAWKAVRDVEGQLARAHIGYRTPMGYVEAEALEVLRGFRAIGPRKLKDILEARKRQRAQPQADQS
jgi:hypothetical protein